jgi:hypothetical protein
MIGLPLKALDETVLVRGEGMRIEVEGKEPPFAFPAAVIFRTPKGPAELTLGVPGFPPVRVPLPKPEKKDEEAAPEKREKVTHEEEPAPHPGPVQKSSGGDEAESGHPA